MSSTRFHVEQLRAILDTAVDGIVTIDDRGRVISFNAAAERMFGYEAADVVDRNVSLLMPAAVAAEHDGYLRRYLETGEARVIGIGREVEGRRRDGSTFPLQLSVSEVDDGDARFFTGILRDASELRTAQSKVHRERDFAESVLETAHAIVLVLDPDGRVLRCNEYFERLTGYHRDDVHGTDWFEHFLPERDRERVCRVFHGVLRGEAVEGNVNAIVTRSGAEREIAWWGKLLYEEDRLVGVLSVGHDVTELHRLQERVVQNERLSAIGEAMAGLTHESRNALARSRANLRMLSRRLPDRPDLKELIDSALKAEDDMRLLFEEVRDYAAPLVLRREPTNVEELVRSAWEDLVPEREDRDAVLTLTVTEADVECVVDRFTLRNAFRNVLENALAATDGAVRIEIDFADAEFRGRPALRVTIRDEGPGIPAADRERLFDAFFTTKTHGTGLGLSIAKRIVHEHGGRIVLGDGTHRGAEFVITLPRREP